MVTVVSRVSGSITTLVLLGISIAMGTVAAMMSIVSLAGDVPFMFREYVRKE